MTDLPDNGSARWRTLGFRDSVIIYLHEAGVPDAHNLGMDGRIDVGPWLLTAHRQATIGLSMSQDGAELAAREAGHELWATVHHRKGHQLERAYVTMPLSVFAAVLRHTVVDALVRDDLTSHSLLTPTA